MKMKMKKFIRGLGLSIGFSILASAWNAWKPELAMPDYLVGYLSAGFYFLGISDWKKNPVLPVNEDDNDIMKPKMGIMTRYSTKTATEEKRRELEEIKIKKDRLIRSFLEKGYTQEQAETEALQCLYISGYSGPTFTD